MRAKHFQALEGCRGTTGWLDRRPDPARPPIIGRGRGRCNAPAVSVTRIRSHRPIAGRGPGHLRWFVAAGGDAWSARDRRAIQPARGDDSWRTGLGRWLIVCVAAAGTLAGLPAARAGEGPPIRLMVDTHDLPQAPAPFADRDPLQAGQAGRSGTPSGSPAPIRRAGPWRTSPGSASRPPTASPYAWRRDESDAYRVECDVPAGVEIGAGQAGPDLQQAGRGRRRLPHVRQRLDHDHQLGHLPDVSRGTDRPTRPG